jgi:peptidyl-tRNA hydrolase
MHASEHSSLRLIHYYPGRIGDAPIMLAKPQTFMNASGESVSTMVPMKC